MVSYLYKKNYNGIALNLVKNLKSKFSLAIDSGNLEVLKIPFFKFFLKGCLSVKLLITRNGIF